MERIASVARRDDVLKRGAILALLAIALGAGAEPRIPELESGLAERLARSDFVFVWDLGADTVGRGDANRAYRTIHDGLMFAVTEGRHWIEPGTPATVKLDPLPRVAGWDEVYAGELRSRQTALDGSALVVHVEVTRRDCDKQRTQFFFALSLEPRTSDNWAELRKARGSLFCDVARSR
jgi:hypothetical protein